MEKITESLEMLYGSSGTPFFLSDEFGNIKWKIQPAEKQSFSRKG